MQEEVQEEKQLTRHQAPDPPAPLPAPQGPIRGCSSPLEHTDLPGDVVKWGADHLQPSAAACCAACSTEPRCNEWVWCGDRAACGQQHLQCWLKRREDPWLDVDMLLGMSDGWTSGITWPRPGAPPPLGGADGSDWDLALVMQHGPVRIKLRDRETPLAAKFVLSVIRAAAEAGISSEAAPGADELHPVREGTRFYRAEPVPSHWGSLAWPDTWQGGRWGPPYSLLQGSLVPKGVRVPPSSAAGDQGQGARPVIRRGMVAWAGGGGGPDFFIALANHPEWGNGHAVWGQVLPEDMALVDGGTSWNEQPGAAGWSVMTRPLRVANWGTINATELVTPVPFNVASNPLRAYSQRVH